MNINDDIKTANDKREEYAKSWLEAGKAQESDKLEEAKLLKHLAELRALESFYNEIHSVKIAFLKSLPYKVYLQTFEWKEKREHALDSAGNRCRLCNYGGEGLEVHHRTYENRGDERILDLIVLCRECHAKFHNVHP